MKNKQPTRAPTIANVAANEKKKMRVIVKENF